MLCFTYLAECPILSVEDGNEVREGGKKRGKKEGRRVEGEKGKFWFSANNLIYHMKTDEQKLLPHVLT